MIQTEYFLSFIIPLWNRESTICYCIDSILHQAADCPFEIIIVDDASSDTSCSLLKELIGGNSTKRLNNSSLSNRFPETIKVFQNIDIGKEMEIRSRVKLIHCEQHRGAANARNIGLTQASGEYIWFVDSDDFIASGSLKTLVYNLSIKKYDILCFSTTKYSQVPQEYIIHNKPCFLKELNIQNVNDMLYMLRSGTVWSRLFCREFIRNYRFNTNYTYSEDSQFIWSTTLNAHHVAFLQNSLYGYMDNMNSLTSIKPYERFKCYVQVVEEYVKAIDKSSISKKSKSILLQECEKRLYLHAFYTYEYHEITNEMWNKWYEIYYNVMVNNIKRNLFNRLISCLIWHIHSNHLVILLFNMIKNGKLSYIR